MSNEINLPDGSGMKTIGYRIVGPGSSVVSDHVFTKPVPGIKPENHEPVVLRREAEAAIAELKDESDERGLDIEILTRNLNDARAKIAELCRPQNRFVRALRIVFKGQQ